MTAPIETSSIARNRLEQIVAEGTRKAGPVLQRILTEVPSDSIVRARALTFDVSETGSLSIGPQDELVSTHAHAFNQVVQRADIPTAYANSLAVRDNADGSQRWRRELLAHMLREHYSHDSSKYLVRTVNGQARGFLSDMFRRLDSRPLLEAFVAACDEVGAVPFEGVASDVRASVRAIIPRVVEPVPGEAMVYGLSWNNSDFGAGTYGVSVFVLRLVCLNGAMGESALKQVHLGGRLKEDLAFSQRTYELDTKTMISATRDVIRSSLSPKALEARSDAIRAAHASETSFEAAFRKVRTLTKSEQQAAKDAFEGPDVLNLPPGKNMWRFSNALSWIANSTNDPERKLDLQRAAGAVLA